MIPIDIRAGTMDMEGTSSVSFSVVAEIAVHQTLIYHLFDNFPLDYSDVDFPFSTFRSV